MNNTNTGGPAFPNEGGPAFPWNENGMTPRDYFAAKAMQAIVSNGDVDPQKISQAAYAVADAMLKARQA
jgi:hypothetical protein